jgi:lipopolysaccharide biosynthesis glycosyltransferase
MIDPRRIAVYIAGDSKIFFPALVAFDSIQKYNRHLPFDYYMVFEGEGLTPQMKRSLLQRDIAFIDTAELEEHGTVDDLPVMGENRWPKHVFYNWLVPLKLHAADYKYAIKADYDLLCVGPYDLDDVQNPGNTIAALEFEVDLPAEGVKAEHLRDIVNPKRASYYNAGFVAINLDRYMAADTFGKFKTAYARIHADGNKVINAEQAALSIVAAKDSTPIKRLDASYNQRIVYPPRIDDEGQPIIRNIHYLTQNKPWLPPNFSYLDHYVKIGRTTVYMYRSIWQRYAAGVEGFSDFVDIKPDSDLDSIVIMTKVLQAHLKSP